MKTAWIVLAVMVACASWAQSTKNSGSPSSQPIEVNISNQAGQNQYPTKDAPLPVTVLQSAEDANSAAERERRANENEKANLEAQISLVHAAWATFAISGVGAFIAILALIFLWRTFRETRGAADATRDQVALARDEFTTTSRAFVFIDGFDTVLHTRDTLEGSGKSDLVSGQKLDNFLYPGYFSMQPRWKIVVRPKLRI